MLKALTFPTIKMVAAGAVVLGGLAAATPAAADVINFVQNGSFELGADGLQSWTITGIETQGYQPVAITYNSATGYPTGAYGEPVAPNSAVTNSPDAVGTHAAYFVSDFSNGQSLTQTLSLTAGTYQVGFSLYLPQNGFDNAGDAHFLADLAGYTLLDVDASALLPTSWYTFAAAVVIGGAGSQPVDFTFTTDLFPSKDVVIDQVYVIANNPDLGGHDVKVVPEPASLALLGSGLLGLALMVGRRRSRQG